MDLTMGGPLISPHFRAQSSTANDTRGGILIRSLRRIVDSKAISGPSLVVDEMFRVCGVHSVAELVGEKMQIESAFSLTTPVNPGKFAFNVKLREDAHRKLKKPIVYNSPRIGLDLSHKSTTTLPTDPRIVFVQKPYRFFTNPNLLTANGRVQTFIGLFRFLSDSGDRPYKVNSNAFHEELCRVSGLKRNVVDKYVTELNWGQKHGKITSFIGPAGKGTSSSPATYLRMMGTLWRDT